MKNIQKLLAVFLVTIMAVGMTCFVAFADESEDETQADSPSITIEDAIIGDQYRLYKMLDLSYDGDSAYSYSVTENWATFFTEDASKYGYHVDDMGYVTYIDDDSNLSISDFTHAALEYANDNNIEPNIKLIAQTNTLVFNDLEFGYYLINTSVGTILELTSTDSEATIQEKNATPTVDKEVQENSTGEYGKYNTAEIGETVNYKETISNVKVAEKLTVHDTLTNGITFNDDSVEITLDGVKLDVSDYTLFILDSIADECTFEIAFKDEILDPNGEYSVTDESQIVVSYDAVVNTDAIIYDSGNPNDVHVSYGEEDFTLTSAVSVVETYVYSVNIYKYTVDEDNNDVEIALSNAQFILQKNDTDENGNSITYYAIIDEDNKLESWTDDENEATAIITDSNGLVTVEGLDAGTYFLTETKAPAGYNKLQENVNFVISEDGTVESYETVILDDSSEINAIKILNNSGNALPGTGGIGTTIFYLIGGALVLAAVVIFITKKRMEHSENN